MNQIEQSPAEYQKDIDDLIHKNEILGIIFSMSLAVIIALIVLLAHFVKINNLQEGRIKSLETQQQSIYDNLKP